MILFPIDTAFTCKQSHNFEKKSKGYFSISQLHSKTKLMYSPKSLLRQNCLRKRRTSHCMLARNEISPPLHAASNACNKSFSVLSRDIGRAQRTALHRGRRWRLLSSVGHIKSQSSHSISNTILLHVKTYLEGGGGGANFLAPPPSCCDQLAEREKLGGAAEYEAGDTERSSP